MHIFISTKIFTCILIIIINNDLTLFCRIFLSVKWYWYIIILLQNAIFRSSQIIVNTYTNNCLGTEEFSNNDRIATAQ
jgi:hypothetical protein